jgi:GNAT superfamily N-acetyltransferase
MEIRHGEYVISDDKSKLQLEITHQFLMRSYWAADRTKETMVRSVENSLCYGVYDGEQNQVAFARVITDGATMYYLCDVFVDEKHRGSGIGKALVQTIVESSELRGLVAMLGTADAHGLYEKYGFEKVPDRFMRKLPDTEASR